MLRRDRGQRLPQQVLSLIQRPGVPSQLEPPLKQCREQLSRDPLVAIGHLRRLQQGMQDLYRKVMVVRCNPAGQRASERNCCGDRGARLCNGRLPGLLLIHLKHCKVRFG